MRTLDNEWPRRFDGGPDRVPGFFMMGSRCPIYSLRSGDDGSSKQDNRIQTGTCGRFTSSAAPHNRGHYTGRHWILRRSGEEKFVDPEGRRRTIESTHLTSSIPHHLHLQLGIPSNIRIPRVSLHVNKINLDIMGGIHRGSEWSTFKKGLTTSSIER